MRAEGTQPQSNIVPANDPRARLNALVERLSDISSPLSHSTRRLHQNNRPNQHQNSQDTDTFEGLDAKTYTLKSLVESFTGEEIDLAAIRQYWQEKADQIQNRLLSISDSESASQTINYERLSSIYEFEQQRIWAKGRITAEGGKEIEFNLQQLLQRVYQEEQYLSVQMTLQELVDPITINLDASSIELTQQRYQFDLNANGELDNIYFVAGNSGFLALDRNDNGVIDNGNELFGPMTGNGYQELARYDVDGNHFIDGKDTIYQHLTLWQKDNDGNDSLTSLAELGIGAIYVNAIVTPFAMTNQHNEQQAQLRQSSIYVKEDGNVGTTHQIDLAV